MFRFVRVDKPRVCSFWTKKCPTIEHRPRGEDAAREGSAGAAGRIRTDCLLRVGSIREDETRAHARSRTGKTPRTKRVLDHREAWARSHAGLRVRGAPRSADRQHGAARSRECSRECARAPAEGIEPSRYRLTAGCLTIRLRWKEWLTRNMRVSLRKYAPSFQRAWVASAEALPTWFRAQESNLRFWIQRPASCQLDDPGSKGRR